MKFEVFHTPGETYDHLTVWLPQYKAAFIGDNYYDSFPTLKPEIVIPSTGWRCSAIYPDLTKLAGGAEAIVRLAQSQSESDNSTESTRSFTFPLSQ